MALQHHINPDGLAVLNLRFVSCRMPCPHLREDAKKRRDDSKQAFWTEYRMSFFIVLRFGILCGDSCGMLMPVRAWDCHGFGSSSSTIEATTAKGSCDPTLAGGSGERDHAKPPFTRRPILRPLRAGEKRTRTATHHDVDTTVPARRVGVCEI